MKDIRYLLSITELLDGTLAEQLREQAYEKLDRERRRKLDSMKSGRKYAECLGAGLLLQLGLQEIHKGTEKSDRGNSDEGTVEKDGIAQVYVGQKTIRHLTVSRIIEQLGVPIEAEYTYGEKGKPYFRGNPVYFSLSHSGNYVFCVFSGQEVGADIQYKKANFSERIVDRFFTGKEQEEWKNFSGAEEKKQFFYKMWARKEAYGKLTGEGIVTGLLEGNPRGVCWEDYEIPENYQIAICKRTGKKE